MKGNFSSQFPLTGKLADSLQHLKALSFCQNFKTAEKILHSDHLADLKKHSEIATKMSERLGLLSHSRCKTTATNMDCRLTNCGCNNEDTVAQMKDPTLTAAEYLLFFVLARHLD